LREQDCKNFNPFFLKSYKFSSFYTGDNPDIFSIYTKVPQNTQRFLKQVQSNYINTLVYTVAKKQRLQRKRTKKLFNKYLQLIKTIYNETVGNRSRRKTRNNLVSTLIVKYLKERGWKRNLKI